jgi:metal-sulfur cluster biosynthetic enzyme
MTEELEAAEDRILEALRRVIDPELGVNIVDLGLIYAVRIRGGEVDVTMTLTTPGCPRHGVLLRAAERVLQGIEGVTQGRFHLVWEPPWDPGMMSEAARRQIAGTG